MDIIKLVGSLLGLLGLVIVPLSGEYALFVMWGVMGLFVIMSIVDSFLSKREDKAIDWTTAPPPPVPSAPAEIPQPIPKQNKQPPTRVITQVSCKFCGKKFADKVKLQRHMGMAHYKEIFT